MLIRAKMTRKVTVSVQQDIVCITDFLYLKNFYISFGIKTHFNYFANNFKFPTQIFHLLP